MGTITISLDDKTEKEFRKTVEENLGKKKGILGKAVNEALRLWLRKKQEKEITNRQLALLEKGFYLGKYKFNREEIYERDSN